MRSGAEYFTDPSGSAQRRYEALRAYFVEDLPAAEVADRFAYSTASVHQMATQLRKGRLELFTRSKPGPKGPRKAGKVRDRVLALRARDHSVTEIAAALTAQGTPVSAQTVWKLLEAEGIPRLARRDNTRRGIPHRLDPVKAAALDSWPAGAVLACDHAGLLLLFPAIAQLRLPELITSCDYPATSQLSAWQSIGTLLLAKCGRISRIHHIDAFTDDTGLGFALGLTALPKATHLTSYSYRIRRDANQKLLQLLVGELQGHGLASGTAGFNLDFHAIRHHGTDAVLEQHYVPARSQRTRAVLTFFAQDHASTEMVYANADITNAEADLLVFDSQLTTYTVLDELTSRGIRWLTLRKRGRKALQALDALPAAAWKAVEIKRAGRYRRPHLHEDLIQLHDINAIVRQIAVKNIGRDQPTLLITNDATTRPKDLFARYAERMLIENELSAYIKGFQVDALTSGLALNVDADTTLTVIAGNIYRLLARSLKRYEHATPETIYEQFIDTTGRIDVTDDGATVTLARRTYTPVLLQAGFAELDLPIPWWGDRRLRF